LQQRGYWQLAYQSPPQYTHTEQQPESEFMEKSWWPGADRIPKGIRTRALGPQGENWPEPGPYRFIDLPPLSDPDLVTVASKIPNGVACLVSALRFHDVTTRHHTLLRSP